uniref:Uncharacterized protein n=1 Tax=Rhizophora mucronata TaxID=61149 RepID=A0A2P2PMV3_RHIMU
MCTCVEDSDNNNKSAKSFVQMIAERAFKYQFTPQKHKTKNSKMVEDAKYNLIPQPKPTSFQILSTTEKYNILNTFSPLQNLIKLN